MRKLQHAVAAVANAKSTELSAVITLGPESAEALGVPVGTQINYGVLASWHRNPLVRLARRIRGQRLPKRDVELARRHQAFALERIKAEAAL
jgi:hypothetical protein